MLMLILVITKKKHDDPNTNYNVKPPELSKIPIEANVSSCDGSLESSKLRKLLLVPWLWWWD